MSIFTTVKERLPQRSKKNLSHNSIYDTGFGRLVPVLCNELTANDYAICATNSFIQPTSLFAPAFTKIRVRQRHFIVPYRLLYGDKYLEEFLSDNEGAVYEPYTTLDDLANTRLTDKWTGTPIIQALQHGQLADFFNIATLPNQGSSFNAPDIANAIKGTPLAEKKISLIKPMSYLHIWNDWYRDENYQNDMGEIFEAIQDLPTFPYVSASDTWIPSWDPNTTHNILEDLFTFQFANVGKDYFMGALPFQQAGNPVRIPVGETAPVFGINTSGSISASAQNPIGWVQRNNSDPESPILNASLASATDNSFGFGQGNIQFSKALDLYADLASAAGIDIVEFRTLLAAQRWYEKNARGGRRLVEVLRSRFGAKVPDIFMDRSVYVGGTVEDVKIDTIFATNNNGNGQLLGDYAGRAYAAGKSKYYGFHTVEPAMFMTIQTILPVPQYWQGIAKDNTRLTVFDKVNPEFARIGEQPVNSTEYFVDYENAQNVNPDAIFGYVPRYADYMVRQDEIHGNFRGDLKFWHTGLELDQNQTIPNIELSDQLLTQDYYKDANRIFTVNPVAEWMANPFRCVTFFEFKNRTCLPANPASII